MYTELLIKFDEAKRSAAVVSRDDWIAPRKAPSIFHTYSVYARGSELVGGVYGYLNHLPKGRNEPAPGHNLTDWVRHHDRCD
jgi:predicted dithiol-disulfide oxidoreductase (DUF899 family)